jgi:hypothetical protein
VFREIVPFDCGMDSIECLAWNGNKAIFEKIFCLNEDPSELRTISKKLKKGRRCEEKKYAVNWREFINHHTIYDSSKVPNCHKKPDASVWSKYVWPNPTINEQNDIYSTLQYIRDTLSRDGVCYISMQRWLENWIISKKCCKYSKFLVKMPVLKRYSKWELDPGYPVKLSNNMRQMGWLLLRLTSIFLSDKTIIDDCAVHHKKMVQTYFGPIKLGVVYISCLKLTGEKIDYYSPEQSFRNRKSGAHYYGI